jgi:hypothetical protein
MNNQTLNGLRISLGWNIVCRSLIFSLFHRTGFLYAKVTPLQHFFKIFSARKLFYAFSEIHYPHYVGKIRKSISGLTRRSVTGFRKRKPVGTLKVNRVFAAK